MKTISEEEYEEFLSLQNWAKREKVYESARSITRLEDDIDFPIKKCVGMFSLLGCDPIYSCCGFDYNGQPFHKTHQYGRPYFVLTANERTLNILDLLARQRTFWYAGKGATKDWINLQVMVEMNPHWRQTECIHFAEECVCQIDRLETFLTRLEKYMGDFAVLVDSNSKAQKASEYWQYPPKESWIIRKEELLSNR